MALPKTVAKDEFEKTIPEAAREHYSLDEQSGEYHLGLVPKGELNQFRDNNINLQKELKALKDKAELYKDIDPEAARQALAKIKELGSNGDGKDLIEKAVNERVANMKKAHEADLTKLTETNSSLQSRLTNVLVNQKLGELALSKDVGIKPEAVSVLQLMAERVWSLDDKGNPIAKDSSGSIMYGNDGKPLEMKAWIVAQRTEHPYLFNQPTGSGANGPKGGNGSGLKRSEMTTKQKSDYISEHGSESYNALPM